MDRAVDEAVGEAVDEAVDKSVERFRCMSELLLEEIWAMLHAQVERIAETADHSP